MQISEIWNDLNRAQQVTFTLVGFSLLIMLVYASIYFFSQKDYSVLFADLQEQDAAAVIEALEKEKIQYQIAGQGSQIMVPSDQVYKTRLKLMGSDMPIHGGVGFEIFDDSSFGTTEFAQKVNYQRALQGELTRTIISLKEVKYARIHLVMPENGLFKRKDQKASASVTLFLHNGMAPNQQKIMGMQRLIGASVPALDAEDVTILDQSGAVLSQARSQGQVAMVQGELDQKKSLENYLKSKAEEVLQSAFGKQQFAISIDVTIDYNESTVTTEDVLPSNLQTKQGLLRSKEFIAPSEAGETPSKVTHEEEYVVGRSVSKTINRPGRIHSISVGVLVPPSTSQTVIDHIKQLVAMSVGVQAGRGDEIVVYPVLHKVDETQVEIAQPKNSEQGAVTDIAHKNSSSISLLNETLNNYGIEKLHLLYALLAVITAVFILLLVRGFLSRNSQLTNQEREQVLLTLQSWVNADEKRESVVES